MKVFSGEDDSVLRSYFAYDATFRGGVVVAAGDVNGDGMADIITASTKGTNVKVYSGVTGNPTVSFTAKIGNSTVGQLVADFTSYQEQQTVLPRSISTATVWMTSSWCPVRGPFRKVRSSTP